jgi:hypothetical protein
MTRYVCRRWTTAAVTTASSAGPTSALSAARRSYKVVWSPVDDGAGRAGHAYGDLGVFIGSVVLMIIGSRSMR